MNKFLNDINKTNITSVIIFIFIVLSMIHLFNMKENGTESFITLNEDQNISPNIKINVPSTDLVQFNSIGISTVPNNLTTILKSKVELDSNNILNVPNIKVGLIKIGNDGTDGSPLRNTINCPEPMFMSSTIFSGPVSVSANVKNIENTTRWHTNDGTGTIIVRCNSIEPEQGCLRIETSEWGTNGVKPTFSTIHCKGRLHINSDENIIFVAKHIAINKNDAIGGSGNLNVGGNLFIGGTMACLGTLRCVSDIFIDNGQLTSSLKNNEGGGINLVNHYKIDDRQVNKWSIHNKTSKDPNGIKWIDGLYFLKSGNNLISKNLPGIHMVLRDDNSTYFDGYIEAAYLNSHSDKRLKENIIHISKNDKDKVLHLIPKTYNMIGDEKKRYGLIAQEVEELYPELVTTNSINGMKSLNYTDLIPLLLAQIKELKTSVPNQNIINTNVLNIGGVTLTRNELLKLKQLINN